jgi:hypothetical protein
MGRLLRGAEKAERTQANEQPPAKGSKAEQSRAEQGREQSRAQGAGRISEHIITYYDSHIPRGGHSGQAQVLGAGAGADGVARMGKSMDRQKNFRRLSVSLSLCPSVMKGSLASTREEPEPGPEATQVARQERHFPSSSPFTFHLLRCEPALHLTCTLDFSTCGTGTGNAPLDQPLISQQKERLGHTFPHFSSRDWNSPMRQSGVPASRDLELS